MRGAAARKSAEATPAPRAAEPGKSSDHRRVQTALKLSDPGDAAEREAVATARTVMRMPEPVVSPRARVPMLAARAPSAAPAPSKAPKDEVSPELTAEIKSLAGSGRPLSPDTRSFLEPRFKANFAGVRVHTGGKAENLATRLGARAFTFGKDIFFNAGAYKPDSPEGMELIAHELTHTIQQREVVQRDVIQREEAVTVQQRTGPEVQRGIVSEALDWIADKANVIPGFRLFTIIIGRNPINMSSVDRSGANILRALIEFIPGGGLVVQALENHGIFEKGGKFIEDQFAALRNLGGAVRDALMEFIDSLGWRDIFRLGSLWDRAKHIFTTPIDKAIAFGKGLVTGIAELVKDAIVKPLGRWAAANIPKWNLLVGVFGKNPISDEGESPASQLIGAFMELIGQQEIWQNIKQGNAVDKAWAWFQKAMKGALSLVTSIPGRVMSTIRSLTIFDIVTLVGAFQKIVGAFSSFVGDFIGWAGGTVLSLLEIIFSVVAPQVVPYLKKAGGAFSKIIKAPGTFISTLVKAGKQGFNQFKAKFVTYLRDALFKWLLGSAEGAGIYFPKSFAPLELLKLGLSVLGLTWANLRTKLVAATNENTVKALEEGFKLVQTLVREGPAAAWEELLKTLSSLKAMVVDAAIDFVKGEVVKIAIEKLVSMLTPAGAFIQAIISIYRTITFIVNKLAEIGRLVAAFIDGIAALANGVVGAAANKVESVLAQGLSLAISFLANFAGLGNIPKKVMQLIKKIQAPVDKAMNGVIQWIIGKAKKLGTMILQAGVPSDPQARLKLAAKNAITIAKALRPPISKGILDRAFGALATRYSLSSIEAFQRGADWYVRIKINPTLEEKLNIGDVEFKAGDVIRAINEVAAELIAAGQQAIKDKPGVVEQRTVQTSKGPKTVEVTRIDLRQQTAIGAGAAAAREKGRQELVVGTITGEDKPMAAGHTPEQQFRPTWPSIKGIGAGGASGPRGNRYDVIVGRLGNAPVGEWMLALTQNKPLPAEAERHRAELEELWALTMTKEPIHGKLGHKRDLAYSLMAVDLMTGPDAKAPAQIYGTEGIHPAAYGDAQAGAKIVTAQLDGAAGSKGRLSKEKKDLKDRRLQREIDMCRAWFDKHKEELKKRTPKPTIADIKNFVRAQLAALVGNRTG